MATTLQFRRYDTANVANTTGANGELIIDSDKHVVVVQDGTTAGGFALARAEAYTQANTARDTANGAYAQANGAYGQANGAYAQANGAYGQANGAYSQANTRVLKSGDTMTGNLNVSATIISQNIIPNLNVTYDLGTSTSRFRDLWLSNSSLHLGEANVSAIDDEVYINKLNVNILTAASGINIAAQAGDSYSQANAARDQANTARITANDAYIRANTARDIANNAYDQANAARGQANTSYGQANAAYGEANLKLNLSGGTVSGDLTVQGNLFLTGNATYLNVATLAVNDSIIQLSTNSTSDALDIGFIGHYSDDGGTTNLHAGFIRHASDNVFYVFDGYGIETTNNVVDIASANLATIRANVNAATLLINGNAAATQANLTIANDQANTARNTANSAYGQANGAYNQANFARGTANNAYAQANDAYAQANSARDQANSAYAEANLKLNLAGGTITGNLTVTEQTKSNVLISTRTALSAPSITQFNGERLRLYDFQQDGRPNYAIGVEGNHIWHGVDSDASSVGFKWYGNTTLAMLLRANSQLEISNNIIAAKYFLDNGLNVGDQASTARDRANDAYGQANTARDVANAAYGQANTANNNAQGAYDQATYARNQANTARDTANGAYGQANGAYAQANGAYTQANGAYAQANGAYAQANGAYAQANLKVSLAGDTMTGNLNVAASLITQNIEPNLNVTYDLGTPTKRFKDLYLSNSTIYIGEAVLSASGDEMRANVFNAAVSVLVSGVNVLNTANGAYAQANGAYGQANGAYGQANGAYSQANGAYAQANSARDVANGAYAQANGAYGQANGAYGQANGAYAQANGAYDAANNAKVTVFANSGAANVTTQTINFVNTSTILVSVANTSGNANIELSLIGAPYDQANAARDQANSARDQANTARITANDAYGQANAAYADSNTRVLKAGDTMTGNLNVAATLITQNIVPNLNITYDIGTPTKRYKDLYLSNSTIYIGETVLSASGDEMRANVFNAAVSVLVSGINVLNTANGAYAQANGAYAQANGAYAQANGAYAQANSARDVANGAYAQANGAYGQANGAYGQANGAYAQANGAYDAANNAKVTVFANSGAANVTTQTINFVNTSTVLVSVANTSGNANITMAIIGTPYDQANSARNQANTARDQANTARDQANTGYGQANSARNQANSAYAEANLKLNLTGGSITGNLTISGNLVVQGNATTINVSNLSVNDSIILLSANATGDVGDIGFVGHFDRGATATHAGIVRIHTLNEFQIFDNYEIEPTNNVIDIANYNYRLGNVRVNTINANSVLILGSAAATQANLTLAHNQANSARDQANTARSTANDAYAEANSAEIIALNAYGQANSARDQANTARTQANTAYGQANDAYAAANTRVLKAGDTMTGNLIVSGATVNTSTANITTIVTGNTLTLSTGTGSNSNVVISANGTEYVRVTNTGNVGIGITSPSKKLHVMGSTIISDGATPANNATLLVQDDGVANTVTSSATFRIANDGSSPTFAVFEASSGVSNTVITNAGNVGVGTISPSSKLHVVGDANISVSINTATLNATTVNAATLLTSAGINVSAAAINAYGQANTARDTANNAYNAANNARVTVFANSGAANATTQTINFVNTASILVAVANTSGNANITMAIIGTPYDQANSARDQANTARTQANTAYGQANDAYGQANTARSQANTARDQANTARTQANTAYGQANDAYAAANTRVLKAGDTMTGILVAAGIRNTKNTVDGTNANTSTGAANNINLDESNFFTRTLTASVAFTFRNAPASGNAQSFTLVIVQNATGGWTPSFTNTVYWAGSSAPPATTTANARDVWQFTTFDGGTTYYGTLSIKNAG